MTLRRAAAELHVRRHMDGFADLQRFREAVLVGMYWLLAVFFPPMVSDPGTRAVWWVVIAGVFMFFAYDAIRYGSRRRVIIRVIIPVVLLVLSSTCYWLIWPYTLA
jgi:hypothetical protein